MSGTEYRRSYRTERLSDVLGRVLGRAAAQMEKRGGRGAHTLDATARCPREGGSDELARRAVGKGLAALDPIQSAASADVFGCAMHASGGNQIASNPARREVGRTAPDHFRPPSSNKATMAG